jgi:hypothetical protein
MARVLDRHRGLDSPGSRQVKSPVRKKKKMDPSSKLGAEQLPKKRMEPTSECRAPKPQG